MNEANQSPKSSFFSVGKTSTWLVSGASLLLLLVLVSCGGGGSNGGGGSTNGGNTDTGSGGNGNTSTAGRLLLFDPTRNQAETAIAGLQYSSAGSISNANGDFANSSTLALYLGNNNVITLNAKSTVTQQDIAAAICSGSSDSTCPYQVGKNLERFFLSLDSDRNSSNGIQLSTLASALNLPLSTSTDQFEASLTQQLAAYGLKPAALFQPSLGMNTEAAQSEQNDIVQPLPFVDIFRTARPFKEYSCADATYDVNGWPNAAPAACSGKPIRTFMLDSALQGMLPSGQYVVLYEGSGTLNYSGYAKLVSRSAGRDVIELSLPQTLDSNVALNRMVLQVASGAVKNIRVIMPGGICDGNPFTRVENAGGCPVGQYRSFEETLATNRNAIIFNPDYLRFLKDFRVVRLMNLMESSPNYGTCFVKDPANPTGNPIIDQTCLVQDFNWSQRAKMDDAVWGASGNTARLERYGRGVPIEVLVELANQLNAHPWFNLLHNATDDYVRQFATYVRDHLKAGLKPHIEYTNETWNGNFWASLYVREKGKGLYTAASNPFWDGAYYYAKRASEVFQIWESVYGGSDKLVRILGTYQSNPDLTKGMLNYGDTKNHVDAVAMGAYFYACWNRSSNTACADTGKIPKTLSEATSLDDIFTALDNSNDPYSLPSLQNQILRQAAITKSFNKALYAYEGGQHLVINWSDSSIDTTRKNSLLDFFKAANRDPRMNERYQKLFSLWKEAGGQQFMVFTVPQTFNRYGTFGIKEYLLQSRSSAPKYDAVMKFQESQGKCWWNGC